LNRKRILRLSDFILRNMEAILMEWEAFAATLLPTAADMSRLELRDHAQQILEAVAEDLTTAQSRDAQSEKSKGRAPKVAGAAETAAQTHAVLRARSGFDINQLVAEYRALRASVLRLWLDANLRNEPGVEDVIRFNEAIDQAIAESVGHYHKHVERARNLLLGMLGHDMRNPLNSIVTTASYLRTLNAGEQVSVAAERLIRSGASIQTLLDDLVDFNRTSLGLGLKIVPSDIDLAAEVADELEQLRGAYHDRQIELSASGNNHGRWDAARMKQMLRNLVSNAIAYGSPNTPVRVILCGEEAAVRLEVTNSGSPIDPATARQMFRPLKRGSTEDYSRDFPSNLGLGLFIVREIAKAHGGKIEVQSAEGETTFAVLLPRRDRSASHG
jgi:signal transduction histidine kinase